MFARASARRARESHVASTTSASRSSPGPAARERWRARARPRAGARRPLRGRGTGTFSAPGARSRRRATPHSSSAACASARASKDEPPPPLHSHGAHLSPVRARARLRRVAREHRRPARAAPASASSPPSSSDPWRRTAARARHPRGARGARSPSRRARSDRGRSLALRPDAVLEHAAAHGGRRRGLGARRGLRFSEPREGGHRGGVLRLGRLRPAQRAVRGPKMQQRAAARALGTSGARRAAPTARRDGPPRRRRARARDSTDCGFGRERRAAARAASAPGASAAGSSAAAASFSLGARAAARGLRACARPRRSRAWRARRPRAPGARGACERPRGRVRRRGRRRRRARRRARGRARRSQVSAGGAAAGGDGRRGRRARRPATDRARRAAPALDAEGDAGLASSSGDGDGVREGRPTTSASGILDARDGVGVGSAGGIGGVGTARAGRRRRHETSSGKAVDIEPARRDARSPPRPRGNASARRLVAKHRALERRIRRPRFWRGRRVGSCAFVLRRGRRALGARSSREHRRAGVGQRSACRRRATRRGCRPERREHELSAAIRRIRHRRALFSRIRTTGRQSKSDPRAALPGSAMVFPRLVHRAERARVPMSGVSSLQHFEGGSRASPPSSVAGRRTRTGTSTRGQATNADAAADRGGHAPPPTCAREAARAALAGRGLPRQHFEDLAERSWCPMRSRPTCVRARGSSPRDRATSRRALTSARRAPRARLAGRAAVVDSGALARSLLVGRRKRRACTAAAVRAPHRIGAATSAPALGPPPTPRDGVRRFAVRLAERVAEPECDKATVSSRRAGALTGDARESRLARGCRTLRAEFATSGDEAPKCAELSRMRVAARPAEHVPASGCRLGRRCSSAAFAAIRFASRAASARRRSPRDARTAAADSGYCYSQGRRSSRGASMCAAARRTSPRATMSRNIAVVRAAVSNDTAPRSSPSGMSRTSSPPTRRRPACHAARWRGCAAARRRAEGDSALPLNSVPSARARGRARARAARRPSASAARSCRARRCARSAFSSAWHRAVEAAGRDGWNGPTPRARSGSCARLSASGASWRRPRGRRARGWPATPRVRAAEGACCATCSGMVHAASPEPDLKTKSKRALGRSRQVLRRRRCSLRCCAEAPVLPSCRLRPRVRLPHDVEARRRVRAEASTAASSCRRHGEVGGKLTEFIRASINAWRPQIVDAPTGVSFRRLLDKIDASLPADDQSSGYPKSLAFGVHQIAVELLMRRSGRRSRHLRCSHTRVTRPQGPRPSPSRAEEADGAGLDAFDKARAAAVLLRRAGPSSYSPVASHARDRNGGAEREAARRARSRQPRLQLRAPDAHGCGGRAAPCRRSKLAMGDGPLARDAVRPARRSRRREVSLLAVLQPDVLLERHVPVRRERRRRERLLVRADLRAERGDEDAARARLVPARQQDVGPRLRRAKVHRRRAALRRHGLRPDRRVRMRVRRNGDVGRQPLGARVVQAIARRPTSGPALSGSSRGQNSRVAAASFHSRCPRPPSRSAPSSPGSSRRTRPRC